MKLQTQIPLKPVNKHNIDYHSHLVLFGSCFSDHIGKKLSEHKLQTFNNPFGILFQPKAIENLIEKALSNYTYSEKDVFELNEQFQSFEAHSKLNSLTKTDLIARLNTEAKATQNALKKASHVVITLGTAWVYKHLKNGIIVANCHKVPQKEFSKELLSIEEITHSLQKSIDLILGINPKVQFMFTVSPVRHLKDGFTQNTLSKAHLISAVNAILKQNTNTHYFPSYEIVMDELRDYRFYNEDLLHPNPTAINHIWECFKTVWFTKETMTLSNEVAQIQKGLNHKPFNENSKAHQQFLNQLKQKKTDLINKIPHISF